MPLFWIFAVIIFLCWGSFLNALAYRLIHGYSIIVPRSFCPNCKTQLQLLDLIPVISWLILKTKCRYCRHKISLLYPAIEILTVAVFVPALVLIPQVLLPVTFIFFSALLVTIRTDFETMLISRAVTLWLIPIATIFAYFNLSYVSINESILGAAISYALLWLVAKVFYLIKNQEGMGEGDFELLAMIGSFIGLHGALFTITIGALMGTGIGLFYYYKYRSLEQKIPFGPWLAFAAIFYVLLSFQPYLAEFWL